MIKPFNISRHQSGVTFIELLFTLLIISVLSQVAHPLYQRLTLNWDIITTTQAIKHSLQRLKANALTHNAEVGICGTSDQLNCSQNWSQGFMQFPDLNRNRKRDQNEPLLEAHPGINPSSQLFAKRKRFFRTWQSGALASQMDSIWYCPPKPYSDLTRRIVVSRIGRVRVETLKDNPDLVCPS